MRDIAGSAYFQRAPLKSGERGYSLEALRQNNSAAGCISIGRISETIANVMSYGFTPESCRDGHYPVIYGLRPLSHSFYLPGGHPMHEGNIAARDILRVYVDAEHVRDAQAQLVACPLLASRVRAASATLAQLRPNPR